MGLDLEVWKISTIMVFDQKIWKIPKVMVFNRNFQNLWYLMKKSQVQVYQKNPVQSVHGG